MVVELAALATHHGPVSGIVGAWRHLVGQQLALADKELHSQRTHQLPVPQQPLHPFSGLSFQRGIGMGGKAQAQDALVVHIACQGIEGHLTCRRAHANQ